MHTVDLAAVIQEACEIGRKLAETKGLEFKAEIREGGRWIVQQHRGQIKPSSIDP
jgi:signal transduction histidine kinase